MNVICLDRYWKKYTTIILAAIVCALLFSYSYPDEYAAELKIADEYKVTDLLIGLNSINVLLRDLNPNHGNETTDDIEVYAKYLRSEDLYEKISNIEIKKYQKSYFQYIKENYHFPFWQVPFIGVFTKDTTSLYKNIIKENIKYNLIPSSMTVDLQVIDQDPVVAAEILDHVLIILKEEIRQHKTYRDRATYENALKEQEKARLDYHKALQLHADFVDSHKGKLTSDSLNSRQIFLGNDYKQKRQRYEKTTEEYTRAAFLLERNNEPFAVVKRYNISHKPIAPSHWAYALAIGIITGVGCLWHSLYRKKRPEQKLASTNYGDLFSPWSITIGIWALVLVFNLLQSSLLYPITSQFYESFAIWVPIFLICSFLTFYLLKDSPQQQKNGIGFNKTLFTVFFAISLIIFCKSGCKGSENRPQHKNQVAFFRKNHLIKLKCFSTKGHLIIALPTTKCPAGESLAGHL